MASLVVSTSNKKDNAVSVETWLESLGLKQYENFTEAGCDDFETISAMEKEDFKEIGIKLGHIIKLCWEAWPF